LITGKPAWDVCESGTETGFSTHTASSPCHCHSATELLLFIHSSTTDAITQNLSNLHHLVVT